MASSSAVGKWIGGILATVLSSVLIYYLTEGRKTPPAAPIEIEGRVVDVSTNALIPGALVLLKTDKFIGSQHTDTEGRYCFVVESLAPTTAATFEIEASGYPRYSINETLQYLSNLEDSQLMRTSAGSPTPSEPAKTPGSGGPAVGGLAGGGKGAAIGALVGRKAGGAAKAIPAPVAPPSASMVSLPRYARRVDPVRIGPTLNKQ
jgi:hypothetical protein